MYTVYLQLWLTRHRWETTQILWLCNAKIVVKKRENAKNSPNMIACSFFMTEKIARLLIQKLSYLCFSWVATASNLFLSTSNSLPKCWYSSFPGIFSIVYISWWKDSLCSSIIASKFLGKYFTWLCRKWTFAFILHPNFS